MSSPNPKATKAILKLQSILNSVRKSGLMSERVTMEQHYILKELNRQLSVSLYSLEQSDPILQIDRLRIFANHLKIGKLVHKFKLEESTYFAEYPVLFPKHWKAINCEVGSLSTRYLDIDCSPYDGEMFFFGLTQRQHNHLFFSYNQTME